MIPLISFFVGSCLFRGMYHGTFLVLSIFLSLSIFYFTGGFVNAGASETQRLDFYTEVGFSIIKIRGGGG